MILRSNILPKSLQDTFVTGFVVIIIPIVYWFELFVVLPTFYEPWSFWYCFHFIAGTFILFNVTSNYVALIVCDTSIRGRLLPANENWKICSVCECSVPPRSWHCKVCNICILKRDHHCIFASCCVGHQNQRFFLLFVTYMFIATLYSTYYNTYFIRRYVELRSLTSLIKVIFPMAMLFLDWTKNQGYLFLYILVVIGCAFTGVLLYYHTELMLRGLITHEKHQKVYDYDLGKKRNVIDVLGERWYLVWLSPFVESKLPQDGINWQVKETAKNR